MKKISNANTIKLTAKIKSGGCAAKISAKELMLILDKSKPEDQLDTACLDNAYSKQTIFQESNLLCGIANFEDAAVYKLNSEMAIIESIDFFPPLLDDPFLYGQIAAANALSDIYAMGGEALLALNILAFPSCDYPLDIAADILKGGTTIIEQAGAKLSGGHSVQSSDLLYGLSVTGLVHPDKVWKNSGAQVDDCLVLTKPIGTGTMLLGLKGEILTDSQRDDLLKQLTTLNKKAKRIAEQFDIHAATDITGFGLIGHLHEMALSSKLEAALNVNSIPFYAGAKDLAITGLVPAAAYANRTHFENHVKNSNSIEEYKMDLLYDPQSSGGLLFALAEDQALELTKLLKEAEIISASIIGHFRDGVPGNVEVLEA